MTENTAARSRSYFCFPLAPPRAAFPPVDEGTRSTKNSPARSVPYVRSMVYPLKDPERELTKYSISRVGRVKLHGNSAAYNPFNVRSKNKGWVRARRVLAEAVVLRSVCRSNKIEATRCVVWVPCVYDRLTIVDVCADKMVETHRCYCYTFSER